MSLLIARAKAQKECRVYPHRFPRSGTKLVACLVLSATQLQAVFILAALTDRRHAARPPA